MSRDDGNVAGGYDAKYLMRESVPALVDVPEPGLIPEHPKAIAEGKCVVGGSPATFHEFHQL